MPRKAAAIKKPEKKFAEPATNLRFGELGRTGLMQSGGFVQEEFLPELHSTRWPRIVREMLANDPTIKAMFFAVGMLCRQVTFKVKAADDTPEALKAKDFIEGCIEDMSQSFTETRSEILSFVPWGWSWHEIVYKQRNGEQADPGSSSKFNDGMIGWRKWAPRAQETLFKWQFDDNGGVQAMEQLAPPDWKYVTMPIEKSLLFRTSTAKGNPEGLSMLRGCYRPWYFKQRIENIEGIGIERDLAGLPHMEIPEAYMSPDATAAQKAVFEMCKKIVQNIRNDSQVGVITPSDVDAVSKEKKFKLALLSTGGTRQFDTNKIIMRYDQRILMTLMADFLMLGHDKVGSFALASSKTELFAVALGSFLDSMCEVINRHGIRRLIKMNGISTELAPTLEHGDIESVDLQELGAYVLNLSRAGFDFDAEQVAFLKEAGNLPVVRQPDGSAPELEEKEEPEPLVIGPDGQPVKVPAAGASATPPADAVAQAQQDGAGSKAKAKKDAAK